MLTLDTTDRGPSRTTFPDALSAYSVIVGGTTRASLPAMRRLAAAEPVEARPERIFSRTDSKLRSSLLPLLASMSYAEPASVVGHRRVW